MSWVEVTEGKRTANLGWTRVGNLRGPAGPPGPGWCPYTMTGDLFVRPPSAPLPIPGGPYTIERVALAVGTAPLAGDVVVDVMVNGTSIYTPATRPRVPDGQVRGVVGDPAITTVNEGDLLTVAVLAVGAAIPGADLTLVVLLEPNYQGGS